MKNRKWILVSALYLVLCLLDGLLTYVNTPDLSMEANPLVSVLGLGWMALFIANAVGFAVYVLAAWAGYRYEREPIPVRSLFDYYMKLFYGDGYKPSWFWYKWCKNRRAFWAAVGFAYAWGMIFGRLVLVIDWSFITAGMKVTWWDALYALVPFRRLDYWVAVVTSIFVLWWWIWRGYRLSEKMSK